MLHGGITTSDAVHVCFHVKIWITAVFKNDGPKMFSSPLVNLTVDMEVGINIHDAQMISLDFDTETRNTRPWTQMQTLEAGRGS